MVGPRNRRQERAQSEISSMIGAEKVLCAAQRHWRGGHGNSCYLNNSDVNGFLMPPLAACFGGNTAQHPSQLVPVPQEIS